MKEKFETAKITVGKFQKTVGYWNYLDDKVQGLGAQVVAQLGDVPQHIAFCMDGNRRYARKTGMEDGGGHIAGFEAMMRLLVACSRMGVKMVTVYAFSIENFNRPEKESRTLFDLVRTKLWDLVNDKDSALRQLGIKIKFLGRRSLLEPDIIERMRLIEETTATGKNGLVINVCAPYTTRDDIASAVASIAAQNNINSESLEKARYMGDAYPLDILVRTSGETRLSDFMAWEIESKCSVEFIPELWPEFSAWKLYFLIIKWQVKRTRDLEGYGQLKPHPPLVSVSKHSSARK